MNPFYPEVALSVSNQNHVGVLLLNLGTPDAPTPEALRSYLREFLSDPRVVEMPQWLWQPILRGIVLPLRSKKSAHAYSKIWLKEGSPLEIFTHRQLKGLRERLPKAVHAAYAMTYGNPSIHEALTVLKSKGVGRLIVVPLYPQYASCSTGASLDKLWKELRKQRNQLSILTISHFYQHPYYIQSLANQIRAYRAQHGSGEKLMFSFHGIPMQQHQAGDTYVHECYETARLVASQLGCSDNDYIVSFQSHFGLEKWVEPSTQHLFSTLPRQQKIKKLDVICPGFVCDCLETMEEIALNGREQFYAAGGTQFHYIPCLNDNADWLDALANIVRENGAGWIQAA